MKFKTSKVVSLLMALLLVVTTLVNPLPVKAATNKEKEVTVKNEMSNSKESTAFSLGDKKKDKVEEPSFKEGEAVVMYYGDIVSTYAKSNVFGSDIEVETIWSFDEVVTATDATEANAGIKNYQATINDSVIVSKVSSKKLSTAEIIKSLQSRDNVVYAEPNYIYKASISNLNGAYTDYQWSLDNTGQLGGTEGADINVESVWATTTGTEKVIAIVDTGVDYTHEALQGNM